MTSMALPSSSQPLAPTFVRLCERFQETDDTFTLVLGPPRGAFAFRPGQFNMLYVFGVGEAAISVSGDPARPEQLVHTIRAVGSVTQALSRLTPGEALGVRGPFGSGWPLDTASGQDLLLVSGGLGCAPLRPVFYHALKHRAHWRRLIWLHGTRSPADLAYAKEFTAWQQRSDLEVHVTVDRADTSWTGPVGLVTALMHQAAMDPERTTALLCGPEVMMRFTQRELRRRGLGDERVFVSLERNMQCAVALCGHCQLGSSFVCLNGPVYRWDHIEPVLRIPEA